MMKDGKLVWTRTPTTRNWHAWAHDNDDRLYIIQRDYDGGWDLTIQYRFSHETQELGWHRLLRYAKQEADRHHHARILESDNEDLKAYIGRYPIRSKENTP